MIKFYETGWAREMSKDCALAQRSITISAISMFPPLRNSEGAFALLWRTWQAAAARGCKVQFFLPAPQPAHPATLRNDHAARIAYGANMQTRFVAAPRLLHAKSAVIDGSICWVGSGNMTAAAALTNHEFYVNFRSTQIAARIVQYLDSIANPA